MKHLTFAALFLPVCLYGQSKPAAPQPDSGEIVFSVQGVCPDSPKLLPDSKDCSSTMTRREFDNLLKNAAPSEKLTLGQQRKFAQAYADVLALAAAAQKAGLEQSEQFRQTIAWQRARLLAELYRNQVREQASSPSEAEIQAYYHSHLAQFEEAKLRRIVLPKNNFTAQDKAAFAQTEAKLAASLRERAAQGADFDPLEKEAYTTLGFRGAPPATLVGVCRRSGLIPSVSEDVFSLKPGQVSKVEDEDYSLTIYQVEDKWTLPEDSVKQEISRAIAKQKQEDALQAATRDLHLDLNESYFGDAGKMVASSGGVSKQIEKKPK